MKTQEQLFDETKILANRIQSFAGFVQNDITEMITDGHITIEDIIQARKDVQAQYNQAVKDLYAHRNEILEFFDKVIEANK